MKKKLPYSLKSLLTNRHWYIIKDHITLKKMFNLLHCIYSIKTNRPHVSSYPFYIKVETTDACHLRCPKCHDDSVKRKNSFLDYNLYKKLIDQLKDYLFEVSLYDQGEPLLDPLIIEYIKYANRHNIGTVISSNFSMKLSQNKLNNLINSGLDYLIVAIDGTTQEIYEKYRVGGKLDLVLKNLKKIVELKKKLHSKKPLIEWQMIDFSFNKSQQDHARILAQEIGVDSFILKKDCYSLQPAYTYSRKNKCPLPWFSFAIECDGFISACLRKDHKSLFVGNLKDSSFDDVWNSFAFKQIRKTLMGNEEAQYCFCIDCGGYK